MTPDDEQMIRIYKLIEEMTLLGRRIDEFQQRGLRVPAVYDAAREKWLHQVQWQAPDQNDVMKCFSKSLTTIRNLMSEVQRHMRPHRHDAL